MLVIVICRTDVIFVLDESGSVGRQDFDSLKSFVSQLAATLDIDSGDTRLGLLTYSTDVRHQFDLNTHSSLAAVPSAIASISYAGGFTATGSALQYVRESMLQPAAGDRSSVPNVVVVFTDGYSNRPNSTHVEVSRLYTGVCHFTAECILDCSSCC